MRSKSYFLSSHFVAMLTCLMALLLSSDSLAYDINRGLTSRLSEVKSGPEQVVLLGQTQQVGNKAPAFKVVDNQFRTIHSTDFAGKTLLISVVPSIDIGICSLQTQRFNREVAQLPAEVRVITISTDLPFAQKRFCQAEQIDAMPVLSDAVWRDFGSKYGLLIKDMGMLTRTILIIDNKGKLAYKQLVSELTAEPDYDEALSHLQQLLKQ
ncbi:thiol peroxidase [Arsukibacterium sp.]|uniref:thiol peroxidase n=1 Tax=Arsukibacterium sp. TaxID=1977258 RepID=UPI002FD90903